MMMISLGRGGDISVCALNHRLGSWNQFGIRVVSVVMASEEAKDPWKGEEWGVSENEKKKPSEGVKKMVRRARKQMPRGLEEKYEAYFLPRKPWPKALAFYGSFILGGIGAGMLLEAWINQKVEQDGGVIWEFDK